MNDYISPPIDILCGVPQGSVLYLYYFLFTYVLYLILLVNFLILPIGNGMVYHIYADDIKLIIKILINSFNSNLELLKSLIGFLETIY